MLICFGNRLIIIVVNNHIRGSLWHQSRMFSELFSLGYRYIDSLLNSHMESMCVGLNFIY